REAAARRAPQARQAAAVRGRRRSAPDRVRGSLGAAAGRRRALFRARAGAGDARAAAGVPLWRRKWHYDCVPRTRDSSHRIRHLVPGQAIPWGKTIFGVLRGSGPVVIMAPGLDSTKEELHAYEEPFLARGMATLAIDGPGQGEAEYEIPICGDYERAARAVCDWIEDRSDLDPK